MSRHPLARLAIHLLLIVSLALPGIAAPAQAVADALSDLRTSETAMPCDGMQAPSEHQPAAPCDCCEHGKCDISACLGTGCLFALPRVVALIPTVAASLPWQHPAPDSRTIEPPQRPPIA